MAKKISISSNHVLPLLASSSIILNLFFIWNWYEGAGGERENYSLSWSKRAAAEAEAVAAIPCSGHGTAYLDGLVPDGSKLPVCECNTCYGGVDCSHFDPHCVVDADRFQGQLSCSDVLATNLRIIDGDPVFLEPFWKQHAASSALLVAGWHRMSYSYSDHSSISNELVKQIRKLHSIVGNAVTDGRFVAFGVGSTQLLNAAVYALSPDNSSSPAASVVASIPFYPVYQMQTDLLQSDDFRFQGDTSLWKNNSVDGKKIIEFVTSPNNPDGQLNKAVLHGSNVKQIYDHAYFWPHFTAIPAPADGDLMIFTLSKFTGHAGSRFGWVLIKDEEIYERVLRYLTLNTMGVSRETQLRVFKLLTVVLERRARDMFEFGHKTMRNRWEKLSKIVSKSSRFSLQKNVPQYCSYFQKIRKASPAYGWLKCEKEEDKDCYAVLQAANITSRRGSVFFDEDRYVRLSLIRRQDDFDLLLQKLSKLVAEENGPKTM